MEVLVKKIWPSEIQFRLSYDDFDYFRKVLLAKTGIKLTDAKKDLVSSRLRPRVLGAGLESYADYRRFLESKEENHQEWQYFVNALTTNKTEFFREPRHFQYLQEKIIPAWKKTGEGCFKAWSAACSSGEEAYTLSMVLKESLSPDYSYKIIGSDIDTKVLSKAQNGVYPVDKLQDVPEKFHGCFDKGKGEIEQWMRIKAEIKTPVSFSSFNLVSHETNFHREFDVVFCRNVMIYFSPQTIEQILKTLHAATKPGGVLFIGHSESLQNIKSDWVFLAPSIYLKK